jgi:hypothetical protein
MDFFRTGFNRYHVSHVECGSQPFFIEVIFFVPGQAFNMSLARLLKHVLTP